MMHHDEAFERLGMNPAQRVKVYFHPVTPLGRGNTNWGTMTLGEYHQWVKDAPTKGLALESVELLNAGH